MSKQRTITSSEPYIIESLDIELSVEGKRIATACAADVGVTVDFTFTPGYAARITADPADSEEGCPDELEIHSIKPVLQVFAETGGYGAAVVLDAGKCLMDWLTKSQIEAIDKAIYARLTEEMEP